MISPEEICCTVLSYFIFLLVPSVQCKIPLYFVVCHFMCTFFCAEFFNEDFFGIIR